MPDRQARRSSNSFNRAYPERLTGRATDRELGTVRQHRQPAILGIRLNLHYAFQVNNVRPVDTDEARWIETNLKARNGLLFQMFLAPAVELDIVILRLHVFQFADGDNVDAGAIAHRYTLEVLRRRASRRGQIDSRSRRDIPNPVFGTRQSRFEARSTERLQEVINGMDLEGAHGVAVIRGNKNHSSLRAY